jgi:hypothetical protein
MNPEASASGRFVVVGGEIIHGNRASQIDAALADLGYAVERRARLE